MVIDIKSKINFEKNKVGNKAYRLNQLFKLGYDICDGYVLSSDFFKNYCRYNKIDMNSNYHITQKIQNGDFDKHSYTELKDIFEKISRRTGEIIVRSSSVEEDGNKKSYAGIFESVLNIKNFDEMLDAIKQVWCSCFSISAKEYNDNENIAAMPILIQEMIACDKSGIMFTKNPVTNKKEIVVEACKYNNHKIISGEEQAQRYTIFLRKLINKTNFLKKYSTLIYRSARLFICSHTLRYVLSSKTKYNFNKILSKQELKKIKKFAECIETDLGYPCDIEWGIKDKMLYIFQARPITPSFDKNIYNTIKTQSLDCILLDRYANPASVCYLSLLESWQNRVYLSFYDKKLGLEFDEKPLCFLNNRVYWSVKYQKKYFEDDKEQSLIKRLKFRRLATYGYRGWYKRLYKYDRNIQNYQQQIKNTNEYNKLLFILNKVTDNFCDFLGVDHFRFLGLAQILYKKLEVKLEINKYDKQEISKIVGTKTNKNKTISANNELLELVKIIRKDKKLYNLFFYKDEKDILYEITKQKDYLQFLQKLEKFLSVHGHRGVDCDDLYYPHWNEDSGKVILLIQQLLKNDILNDTVNDTVNIIKNDTAVEDSKHSQKVKIKDRKLKKLVHLTGEYMCLRENQRYYFDKSWVLIRQILLKLSDYYISNHIIEEPQDIFHMTIDEIEDGIRYKNYMVCQDMINTCQDVINSRKKIYEAERYNTPPYIIKDSQNISVQKGSLSKSYKVMGISAGYAVGKIKVINNLEDIGNINKNDIGVVKTFHPSWTPILKVVSGLIMSYGNMLSHGAVVAREYKIPVVVFNDNAAKFFTNGDTVEINGTTGRIKVLT